MGCVWVYMQKIELPYWWGYGVEKTRINLLYEKRSMIPWGLRMPIWKTNFVLVFCSFPNCLDEGKGRKLPYTV